MRLRRSLHPALLLAAAALTASVSCREQTAPRDARPGPGGARPAMVPLPLPNTPSIRSLSLDSKKLAIGGASTPYVVTVRNTTGVLQTGIHLQGEIVQGQAVRGAGGFSAQCPAAAGLLPPGTCTMALTVTASNTAGGTGTLVEGPAHFVLRLLRADGVTETELDRKTVEVFLGDASPSAPEFR